MFREGPRLRASAHEAVDWHHTTIYTALPGYRALLLPGTPEPGRLAAVVAGRGGATVAVEAADDGAADLPAAGYCCRPAGRRGSSRPRWRTSWRQSCGPVSQGTTP